MKSFIEELYYGNIDPQNSGFRLGARFVLDTFLPGTSYPDCLKDEE